MTVAGRVETVNRYRVISADSHVESSPILWAERLPSGIREQAPKVVPLPDGKGSGWQIGDSAPVPLGLSSTGGLKYSQFQDRGELYDGMPGTGDPKQRLREQDEDGLDAELIFASPFIQMLKAMKSPDLIRASCAAFNDWLSDYCAEAPDRLFGVGIVPPSGLKDAIAEVERIATLPGLRGAQLLKFPSGEESIRETDDDFWGAAAATGVCVMGHHNFGGQPPANTALAFSSEVGFDDPNLKRFVYMLASDVSAPTNPLLTVLQIIVSGALDRHPALRLHFAETGIGWLPYWLEQMEDRYDRHRFWAGVDLPRRPIEYIRDHFTFSFQEDHAGVRLRDMIGVDVICWASDFPHSLSDWPWSAETRARQFRDVPADERRKMEALNLLVQLGMMSHEERAQAANEALHEAIAEPELVATRGERRL
jgi:predicted TIM-barrel fold metal-dependent hydrolase